MLALRPCLAGAAAAALAARRASRAEEARPYQAPARLPSAFAALPASAPADEAGRLAWAVKHLDVPAVQKSLESWPHGATLLDSEDNTLFHLAASQGARFSARPEAARRVFELLLRSGWDVVDLKNKQGERAERVAARGGGAVEELLKRRSQDFREELRPERNLQLIPEASPCPWKWSWELQDERRRSYAAVLKGAVGPDKCRDWVQAHWEKGAWIQPEGVPRRTAWYVSKDCLDCPYRYSGLEYPATEFPEFMQDIRAEVCRLCGIGEEDYPNSCNVNIYEDGGSEVGWHSDDEVLFQGLRGDTRIVSFSLGAPRDFCWRLQGTTEEVGRASLGDGDIMTMEGLFQKHYKHAVPPTDKPCGLRINMTFRWIVVKADAVDAGTVGAAA